MLSAQLDGEDDPADRPLVEQHLSGCAGCRQWLDRAAAVNRMTSTRMAPAPDLTEAILAALPAGEPRTRRWPRIPIAAALFVALAAVGAVQLILGLDQIGGGVVGVHEHTASDATPGHLWHESAAWNVAVGAGYLFIALRRVRPSGLVPMLTAFVGMLVLLSVNDLSGGRVDATRLVSHGFVIIGYLLIVTLSRIPGGFASTPPGARAGKGWTLADEPEGTAEPVARPGLRLVTRGPMTARHDERHAA
ncbi:membrane protein [Paractinoplanes deccanensis]|uniref:Membrane protein n=2 Tax=Paractinoplanes deccanensis TaxID=113561 RepID=A0ABQ3YCH0_9ACTN|nr:membrane protein [Actinoplanes deccanensis]